MALTVWRNDMLRHCVDYFGHQLMALMNFIAYEHLYFTSWMIAFLVKSFRNNFMFEIVWKSALHFVSHIIIISSKSLCRKIEEKNKSHAKLFCFLFNRSHTSSAFNRSFVWIHLTHKRLSNESQQVKWKVNSFHIIFFQQRVEHF